jgi:hypothetical protein
VSSQQAGKNASACVEHGIWTPVPTPPPHIIDALTLHYKDIDAADHDRIIGAGRMTFHLVGCSGDASDHQPQQVVADGMAQQVRDPGAWGASDEATNASFLYHLGDVIYKPGATSDVEPDEPVDDATVGSDEDRGRMYNDQFYAPYAASDRSLRRIPLKRCADFDPAPRTQLSIHRRDCGEQG